MPSLPAAAPAAGPPTGGGRSTDRLPGLDALRLVAVAAVVAFHYLFRGPVSGWVATARFPGAETVAAYGYAGVDLFFVISGFVIAWSSEGRDPVAFARARLLRLYPAFLVCMTATALILAAAREPTFPVDPLRWAANIGFLPHVFGQGFVDSAYWSIVAELTFYGWVFVGMATGVWPRHVHAAGWIWLAVSLANLSVVGSGALDRLLLTSFAGEFLGGVMLYRLRAHGADRATLALLAASVAVAVVQSVPYANGLERMYGFRPDPVVVALVHVAIFALVAAAAALRLDGAAARAAVVAGGVTYPLYLLHQNVGYVAIDRLVPLGLDGRVAVALVSAAMLAASYGVWRHVEPDGRRLLAGLLDPVLARLPGPRQRAPVAPRPLAAAAGH